MARTPRRQTRSAKLARQLSASELAFKQKLVKLREERDMSQTQVAEIMGVDKSAVSRFERIDSNPRLATIRAYALAIDAVVEMSAALNKNASEGSVQPTPTFHDYIAKVASAPSVKVFGTSRSLWDSAHLDWAQTSKRDSGISVMIGLDASVYEQPTS
ncbi:helix-turn-helix transcriptional regulator [Rhodococcus fascians]|uniref:helix-turn-helix domain-containing protein n=1 Tax=Rhodococcoides fascians TaxID=1828 RepID=UPI0024B9D1E1|nr:helix-turn-helix transcriptional regulator [Rhodococcus fascians]MDJ0426013.1 helix-turn-helix transcriptional regulator [Rhodococcus fascians]